MREILFRGKHNSEWIYGYYAVIGKRSVIIKSQSENFYSVDENLEKKNGNEIVDVDEKTICQYTGLTDRECGKIFEGDIVKESLWTDEEPFIHIIQYSNKYNVFATDIQICEPPREPLSEYLDLDKCEVIGNIFDNPELLKGDGAE